MCTDAIHFVFLSQSHPAIAIMNPNKQADVSIKLPMNILTMRKINSETITLDVNLQMFLSFHQCIISHFSAPNLPTVSLPGHSVLRSFLLLFLQLALIFIILSDFA